MECTVSWTGNSGARSGMGFVAETGSGHAVLMDGAPDAAKPENGGQTLAPRPMERVLAAHPEGRVAGVISSGLLDRTSDVSRLVDRMVKLGYVERRAIQEDGRVKKIFLTLRGLELLGQIRSVDKFTKEDLPKRLTDQEAQMLSALLDKVRT